MKMFRFYFPLFFALGLIFASFAEVKASVISTKTAVAAAECGKGKKAKSAKAKAACIASIKRIAMIRERKARQRAAAAKAAAIQGGLRTETASNIASDNILGENLDIRQAAVKALGSHAGTVVVMDAKTGELLTVVNQEWAIRENFKPCSVIKLVTGAAGLDEGIISDDGTIANSTAPMKLDYALAKSNNDYFQRVGKNLAPGKFTDTARKFGLGSKTGVNVPDESPGKLPYGKNFPRVYSHGDNTAVTPLQLAVMVTAIANGGKKVTPWFNIGPQKPRLPTDVSGTVELSSRSLVSLTPGMRGSAEYGTASKGLLETGKRVAIAGKTGSCLENGTWVGLFASVAPVQDPKYAVVVINRGSNERGFRAAEVVRKIYDVLFPAQIQQDSSRQEESAAKDEIP